jgi:hypothetical protein
MKCWQFTCWALVTLLLMHGGGVFSSLHNRTHHQSQRDFATQCDHAHAHHASQPGDDQPTPIPSPDHDNECSICLGLSGLHFAKAPAPTQVVVVVGYVERRERDAVSLHQLRAQRDHSARAPPIC